jgi:hypothetical protein
MAQRDVVAQDFSALSQQLWLHKLRSKVRTTPARSTVRATQARVNS